MGLCAHGQRADGGPCSPRDADQVPARKSHRRHDANRAISPGHGSTMTIDRETFAIVGTSLAGAKAAQTVQDEGFDGRLVLVGAEPERPCERPPLSKEYLRGEAERDAVFVQGASFYADNEIERRLGESVIDVDAD